MLNELNFEPVTAPRHDAPPAAHSAGPGPRQRLLAAAVAVAALVLFCGRLAAIFGSELFPDEALYVWISRVDPLGFAPHPPGVPALTRIGMALLGRTEEGVRLGSFVLATLTPVPVYILARALAGREVALWSVLAVLCVPIYGVVGAIATPDAPQLFLWAVALWLTWRALETGRLTWWAAAGITLGLGLFVKYIIVLYFPSLALCLLLSPRWRRHLRTPGPYVAGLLAFALFAPAFLWNQSAAGWTAVRYHLEERQDYLMPSVESFAVYHGLHLVYVSPLLYGLALGAMVWAGVQAVRRRDERLLFLVSFSAVTWLFFAAVSLVTKRELSREQWDAPAYIPALIAAALLLWEKMEGGHRNREANRLWRRMGYAAPLLGLAIYTVTIVEGITGRMTAIIGEAPLYANFRGWSQMSAAAEQSIAALPPGPSPPFLLGNSFVEALQFEAYASRSAAVRALTLDNSANDRFGIFPLLVQEGINQGSLARISPGSHAIFAMVLTIDPGENADQDGRREKLEQLFEQVELLPEFEVMLSGRPIRRVQLYRCLSLKPESRW